MSELVSRVDSGVPPAIIRPYRPTDHRACRALWVEHVRQHRELYEDQAIGGADPGVGFEEYLTRLDLSGMWVADLDTEGVIGLVGLLIRDRFGEVEPIVVAAGYQETGVGQRLLDHVAGEGRKRALTHLTASVVSRAVQEIRSLHDAGYAALSGVTLTMDLTRRTHRWRDGLDLHSLRFDY